MSEQTTTQALPKDYTYEEVADALGMSSRWVRLKVKEGAEHQKYGHKVRFTADQVEKLRASCTQAPTPQSITTGRKRSR